MRLKLTIIVRVRLESAFNKIFSLMMKQPAIELGRLFLSGIILLVDILKILQNNDGCVWWNLISDTVHVDRHSQAVEPSTNISMRNLYTQQGTTHAS